MINEVTVNKVNEMAPVVASSKRTTKADADVICKILTDAEKRMNLWKFPKYNENDAAVKCNSCIVRKRCCNMKN